MIASARVPVAAAIVLLAGCASAGRSDAQRAVIFSGSSAPTCGFEVLGEVTAVVTVRGGRSVAEDRLHQSLARAAERRGGDGVVEIEIKAPERVPFVVTGGSRPSEADLPALEWSGRGQAIRFADSSCRR